MNTPTFESTLEFIKTDAHADVMDKGGLPYWQHPLRVATNVGILFPEYAEDEEVLMAALLHDVMEDTECDYSGLVTMGYSHRTTDICWWLDKNCVHYRDMTYLQKIQELADHGPVEALAVKYADLTDNSDARRSYELPASQRIKYEGAMAILENELSSRDFAESTRAYAEALK
jgi:(p)ppGpp synthase/HD superfamily hydrolase